MPFCLGCVLLTWPFRFHQSDMYNVSVINNDSICFPEYQYYRIFKLIHFVFFIYNIHLLI